MAKIKEDIVPQQAHRGHVFKNGGHGIANPLALFSIDTQKFQNLIFPKHFKNALLQDKRKKNK